MDLSLVKEPTVAGLKEGKKLLRKTSWTGADPKARCKFQGDESLGVEPKAVTGVLQFSKQEARPTRPLIGVNDLDVADRVDAAELGKI